MRLLTEKKTKQVDNPKKTNNVFKASRVKVVKTVIYENTFKLAQSDTPASNSELSIMILNDRTKDS